MSTVAVLEEQEVEVVELPKGSKNYLLSALFRCDHGDCGAQSYIRATLKSGGELFFCGHHAHALEANLKPQCKEWYTEENRLIEDRKTGSEN